MHLKIEKYLQEIIMIISASFQLGDVVVTNGIIAKYSIGDEPNKFLNELLQRHASCDWGDVCEEDKQMNNESLKSGNRLLSLYEVGEEYPIYIITEADRSVTTILFADEY